jgi:3-(3-hydroxy-phenyl)propionate hydroxylase
VEGQGGTTDPDGHLRDWFAGSGAVAVLLRPDFFIYGTANAAGDIAPLVAALAADLGLVAAEGTTWAA